MHDSEHDTFEKRENSPVSRRRFLESALAGTVSASTLINRAYAAGSAKKLKMGLIGAGWYGMVDVKAALGTGGVEMIATCDVDSQHLQDSADQIEKLQGVRPKTFKDYRQLLELPDLQAVIIATPPQWHALPFLAALERGLDIYAEKPLAYDIREGQAMVAAAQKTRQIVQVGFQRRQSNAIQQAKDAIQSGKIGRVVHVDVQIHYTAGMKDPTPQDPPASLDWDLWCGPAPKLPYSPQIGHKSWRLEKAYGNGHLVDWGIHLMDATRWMLDEKMPEAVQATGGIYYHPKHITTPDILTAHFDYPTCPVTWRHRLWGAREYTPDVSNGIFFYGEKGTVFATDQRWVIMPKGKNSAPQVKEVKSDMGAMHMAQFLDSVQTRQAPLCTPQEGYYSTSAVQLAMIAYEMEEKLYWDADAQEIAGNGAANRLLQRAYRGAWVHPYG